MPAVPTFGEQVHWDHVTTGLGLRLRAGSPSIWIYRRRLEGKLIKQTLARADAMNLDQARAAAETVAVALSPGLAKISLRQFAETFMRDCAGWWRQPRSNVTATA